MRRFSRITGTGSYLPPRRVTNDDFVAQLAERGIETSDQWIVERTGIRARHFAERDVASSDLALEAARKAIEAAGKLGEIIVGGVDASSDALAEMDAGRLNVTVFQNAVGQGEGGIATAIALARGEPVEQVVWIPYEPVTPENYKDYMK